MAEADGVDDSFLLKEKVDETTWNWEITGLTFDALSSAEIVKYSNVRITHEQMYAAGGTKPVPHGPMDLHLGANRAARDDSGRCQTCGGNWDECVGHWGYVKLPVPVFHPGYFKWLINILYCFCKNCSTLLVPDEMRRKTLRKMIRFKNDTVAKKPAFKELVDASKKITRCSVCGHLQGMLRRVNQGTPDKFMKSTLR